MSLSIKVYLLVLTILLCLQTFASRPSNLTQCIPNACGPNAECFDDRNDPIYQLFGEPYCQCLFDSVGNPPDCIALAYQECFSEGGYFYPPERVCKKGCRSHKKCKLDEYCSVATGKCEKGCRSNFYCKSNEKCDVKSRNCVKKCVSHKDCKYFEYCDEYNEMCTKGCHANELCKPDEYCNHKNVCAKGCRSDGNCKRNEFCDDFSHKCVYGCLVHEKCNSDEFCNNDYKCEKLCSKPSICGKNSKCTSKNHKMYCSCLDGYFPSLVNGTVECKLTNNFHIPIKDGKIDCPSVCGSNANCEYLRDTFYCFCEHDKNYGIPFGKCTKQTLFRPDSPNRADSSTNNKPGQEVPISQACIKSLICG